MLDTPVFMWQSNKGRLRENAFDEGAQGNVHVKQRYNMETKVELAYLYDFYGELLNEHQKQIYEDYVLNDFSLAEIASEEGISRQGVHDMIKRCTKKLMDYENKLHLVEKFMTIKENVGEIHELAKQFKESKDEDILNDIETISNQILEEL